MSIEGTLIAQAQPYMLARKAQAVLEAEITKGCSPDIWTQAVALEPAFHPISHLREFLSGGSLPHCVPEPLPQMEDLVRFHVWISPDQGLVDWDRSERFLKQLHRVTHRVGLEIMGNEEKIFISFLCHKDDQHIISAVFSGEFNRCELSRVKTDPVSALPDDLWNSTIFYDYFPPAPYSHLLTRPAELHGSPYEPLITALFHIPAPAVGMYQALFQPVSPQHNWHRNVQALLDLEFQVKLMGGGQSLQRYGQQTPSGELRGMAYEVDNKAHTDKPFFAAAIRIGVIGCGDTGRNPLDSLSTLTGLFQHGGRPLNYITEKDYAAVLPGKFIQNMFIMGLSYRSGFLMNSLELSGIVHMPPASILDFRQIPLDLLETLPVRNKDLGSGTPVGIAPYAGTDRVVCIPPDVRLCHTHMIGRPRTGKSCSLGNMILYDIEKGDGAVLFDPHGDLIDRLLCLLKEEYIDRIIYFDPGDPNFVPLFNPLYSIPGQDLGRRADDLVSAIKSFVGRDSWGDRLENIFRAMIFSLMHLPQTTFLDLSRLLRNKSDENKKLRDEILRVVDNETVRQFWLHDYDKYSKDDLNPPRNKLSKLLVSGTVYLMLSQTENRFNFRKIMDEGMILLINLSTIGTTAKEALGCFFLSLLHLAALSRSDIPESSRKAFHVYCDEAHRFMTDALEDLIAETRKFGVPVTLAHQYMSQFGEQKADALSSVGSTIIFNVDTKDAGRLKKDLRGLVDTDDIISLGKGEAIARIDRDVIKIKTFPPRAIPSTHLKQRIIEESHRRYYKPAPEVKEAIRLRRENRRTPHDPFFTGYSVEDIRHHDGEELVYDELP